MKPLLKKSLVNKEFKAQNFRSNSFFPDDVRWMRAAIAASRQAVGRSGVNPPVGCVLISADGRLLSVGHTGKGGVPHAERAALQSLRGADRSALQGGTAYVTLEPCIHHGKTPPCSNALIGAGIKRLVVALEDPDPRMNGGGLDQIAAANIEVISGVLQLEYEEIVSGFINKIKHGKPLCSIKIAASIDGKIALSDRKKRWITGLPMRRYVHFLRSQVDAIVTGIGTVLADNPEFNCRNAGLQYDSPPIYVLDRLLRTPPKAKLFQSLQTVTLFCGNTVPDKHKAKFSNFGATVVVLPDDSTGKLDVCAALKYMGSQGLNHVLIEAGTEIVTAFINADLVDQIYWTQSNHILGADTLAAVGAINPKQINKVAIMPETKYTQSFHRVIGSDRLTVLKKVLINSGKTQA